MTPPRQRPSLQHPRAPHLAPPRPVAIGGLGGSGTRVVALLMRGLGYHLGPDLNESLDNLTFTLLFKRPRRFTYCNGLVDPSDPNAQRAVSVFHNLMSQGRPTASDLGYFLRAVGDVAMYGHDYTYAQDYRHRGRFTWALRRLTIVAPHPRHDAVTWGWKEPNSYIFLPALYERIPDLFYVHVIRDGLDMAYSSNLAQLQNWADLFNVNNGTSEPAVRQLQFWARANSTVCAYLAEKHAKTSCVLRYEDLMSDPVRVLQPFVRTLGYGSGSDDLVDQLLTTTQLSPSSSMGRHRGRDVSALLARAGSDVRDSLTRFGYGS